MEPNKKKGKTRPEIKKLKNLYQGTIDFRKSGYIMEPNKVRNEIKHKTNIRH
jgi:hypothetical protein